MISKRTKYAINALVYLAREDKDHTPIQISKIAESEHIPRKFLEAILLILKNAGYLSSKKGKEGGYYMHKKPSEISLADIMRLFDGPIAFLPCATHMYYERCEECKDEETCGIRAIFLEVRNETVELLKRATLEEIMNRSEQLGFLRKGNVK